jgi:hypothetical protein
VNVPYYPQKDDDGFDFLTLTFELVEKVVPDADNFEPKSFDNHNTSQVLLPKNDAHMLGTAVT